MKEKNGLHWFIETSAKDGDNVQEVFIEAAKVLLIENEENNQEMSISNSILIENTLDSNRRTISNDKWGYSCKC